MRLSWSLVRILAPVLLSAASGTGDEPDSPSWLHRHSPLHYLTQSLWRDEAFSVLMAERPLSESMPKLTVTMPLHPILLRLWVWSFGTGEFAVRSLSLTGFALAIGIVVLWSRRRFPGRWCSWYCPLFFALNPMLLYYACEVRPYAWYAFLAVLTLFAFVERRWILFTVAAVLGFYTHAYHLLIFFALFATWLWENRTRLAQREVLREPMIRAAAVFSLLAAPYLCRILIELAQRGPSWYLPMSGDTARSVLGMLLIGYEGRPDTLRIPVELLSWGMLGLIALAMWKRPRSSITLPLTSMILLPVALVVGISFFKPVFVLRYLIPCTVAEVFLLVELLDSIAYESRKKFVALVGFGALLAVNLWFPPQIAKTDLRTPIRRVSELVRNDDLILAESSLVYFETLYYSRDRFRVRFFDPRSSGFPWYVGIEAFDPAHTIHELPPLPQRAYLIRENGTWKRLQ